MSYHRSIAATSVVIGRGISTSPTSITIDDSGVVVRIVALADCPHEPHSTLYYSGVITPVIENLHPAVGTDVRTLVDTTLGVGYSGGLLLWQNLSAVDFLVTDTTTIQRI